MINMTGEEFRFVKKVLYKEEGSAEEQYGEYEMDHIFLCRISDPKAAKPVASEIH